METTTITEALQEIKTILARIEKKRGALIPYLARDSRARDPFENSGGSVAFIRSERQSIADLEKRVVAIRTAIQQKNLSSSLEVGSKTQSVAEWLTWRREIAKNQELFVSHLLSAIRSFRADIQKKGGRVVAVASAEVNVGADAVIEMVVSVDEKDLLSEQDEIQKITGALDGKLSLFNATAVIEF